MNATLKIGFSALGLLAGVLLSAPGYGQYYPGMGGMGGMGGRGMRGMGQNMPQSSSSRPMIPNIAGDLANKETTWLKENLSLTKEQSKAVKKLNNDYASQQQDAIKDIIGTNTKPTPEIRRQIRDMMTMLNEEKEDRLKTLLTPEQWTTFVAKKPEMQKAVGSFRAAEPDVSPASSAITTPAQPQSTTN